jgi:hypothetical protein
MSLLAAQASAPAPELILFVYDRRTKRNVSNDNYVHFSWYRTKKLLAGRILGIVYKISFRLSLEFDVNKNEFCLACKSQENNTHKNSKLEKKIQQRIRPHCKKISPSKFTVCFH